MARPYFLHSGKCSITGVPPAPLPATSLGDVFVVVAVAVNSVEVKKNWEVPYLAEATA